jgi:phage terminase small subunit
MDEKKLKSLRIELNKRIDRKSKVQQEKVERYLNLVKIYYMLDEAIEKYGVLVTTENGAQRFTKPNPAIAEKNKINSSLIALGKDLGLDIPPPTQKGTDDDVSDLI